jgi:type II secretory pathway pseudopilin PulG
MIRLRRAITRHLRNEGGVGLVEFMVAIALFGVLSTVIISALMAFNSTLARDQIATANTNLASAGMNEVTRVIRAATAVPVLNDDDLPAFEYANKEKIILYAYVDATSVNPAPIRVQFEVGSDRNLVEKRWIAHPKPGYPSYWEFYATTTTPDSTRIIARKIVAPATGEVFMFQYYQIDQTSLLPALMTIPVTGITDANLTKIAVVGVTMKVQTDTKARAEPVTITNQVGIPNLGISRLGIS